MVAERYRAWTRLWLNALRPDPAGEIHGEAVIYSGFILQEICFYVFLSPFYTSIIVFVLYYLASIAGEARSDQYKIINAQDSFLF